MFGSDNSIEPVRAVAAVAVRADGSTVAQGFVEPMIREATAADLAAAARRANIGATTGQAPGEPAAEAKGGFFRRRVAEPVKPDAVAQQHGLYTAEKRGTRHYYADYQQKREVMWAGAKSISSKLDDRQTVSAMLDLAQSRGWNTVRLKGIPDFQREAWVQSQARGMAAEGYKPTATDQQEAARRIAAAAPVKAASSEAAESKPVAGTGAPRDTAKVTNTVTVAASAQTEGAVSAKAPAAPAAPKSAFLAALASIDFAQLQALHAAARANDPVTAADPAALLYTPKVQQGVAAAAPAQKADAAPAKAVDAGRPKPAAAAKSRAATSASAASVKAAPVAAQAPTAAAGSSAVAAKAKAAPVQRKNVWDAVEAVGKQARAADAAAAKATAGERPRSAVTA